MRKDKIDEILEQRAASEKARKDIEKNMLLACSDVFSTKNGKFVGTYLMELCGYQKTDNDVNPNKVNYYMGRRDIYLELRKFIPVASLIDIEIIKE